MRLLSTLFIVFSLANTAMATSPIFVSGQEEVTVELDTQVIMLDIQAAFPHNCPSRYNLEIGYNNNGVVTIDHDQKPTKYLNTVKRFLSVDAQEEVELAVRKIQGGPTCLSFGKSHGRVFYVVSERELGETLLFNTPVGTVVSKVTQLK